MDNPRSHTGAALRDYETSILPTPVADVVVSSDIDAQEAEQAGLTARIAEPDAPYGAGDGTPLQSLMRARRQSAMSIEIRNAREHNLKNVNVEIPRDKFTVITGVSGSGKSTWPSTSSSTKASAATWNRSTPTPAPSCSRPASRRGRHLRDPAHGRHRAAHQPWRTQVHRGHDDRDPSLPAPALRQAGHAVLPRLQRRRRAAEHRPDRGPPAARAQGEHIGLLAPLVTARKGYYTDLAKWAGARDHSHLRVDGQFIPVARGRAWTLQGTHHRAAGGGRGGRSGQRGRTARRGQERAGERPGRDVRGLAGQQAARGAGQRPAATTLLGQARLPVLRHQLPEPDPRLFSYNSSTAGAPAASAPACSCRASTRSRPARKPPGTPGTKARPRSARSATASA